MPRSTWWSQVTWAIPSLQPEGQAPPAMPLTTKLMALRESSQLPTHVFPPRARSSRSSDRAPSTSFVPPTLPSRLLPQRLQRVPLRPPLIFSRALLSPAALRPAHPSLAPIWTGAALTRATGPSRGRCGQTVARVGRYAIECCGSTRIVRAGAVPCASRGFWREPGGFTCWATP